MSAKRPILIVVLAFLFWLSLGACGGVPVSLEGDIQRLPDGAANRTPAGMSGDNLDNRVVAAPVQVAEAAAAPSGEVMRFTLSSSMQGGLAFKGEGSAIDGQLNPDLIVPLGTTVELTLLNGDGMLHDLVVDAFGVATPQFAEQGASQTFSFVADRAGTFEYHCSVVGHKQAGMVGKLVVGGSGDAATTSTGSVNPYADDKPSPIAHPPAIGDAPVLSADPNVVPAPIGARAPQTLRIDLETTEVVGTLADGTSYEFWTFNDTVPGPMLRVRVGDTVELHLTNNEASHFAHSIDFHAMTGFHGGGSVSQAAPGEEKVFTWKALQPGVFVYHCATPMVPHHIANGMYGLIVVEPEGGLPPVDREFYLMQGEVYSTGKPGDTGHLDFDVDAMLEENPNYVVFNGSAQALTEEMALRAKVGETVRVYMGVGGPNLTSGFHVIGEIFERVYDEGSITSPPLTDVQTTVVPPGGATVVEFRVEQPGTYVLVDHALGRLVKGLKAFLIVEGDLDPMVSHEGPAE